jgi:glycosyltransferase involved in cell wall biosynthesis
MKVFMITSYPPEKCGVADYSQNLVESLSCDVKVFTDTPKKKVQRSLLQIIEEIKTLPKSISCVFKTIWSIHKEKPDVVHIQYEPGLYNIFYIPKLLFALKFMKPKTIITLHGIDYFPLNIFHTIFLYQFPDEIITHTKYHSDKILTISKKSVIPMGIPTNKGKFTANDTALFFGFMSPHKGLEYLVQAFNGSKYKLKVVGSINPAHHEEVEYRNKIQEMKQDNVKFISHYLSRSDLNREITNSSVVIFPYTKTYSAGQSQALIDAISFGKPVVITDLPTLKENLVHGKNAMIVKSEDAQSLRDGVERLLGDKKLLRTMHNNNMALAKRLSWKNIAKITEKHYR